MGLSSSSRIFTKLMKPVLAELRQKGHINSGYIAIRFNVSLVCGFILIQIIPKQEITLLGLVVNSLLMTVTLTDTKKKQLLDLCTHVLLSLQFIASFISKLIAVLPGVELCRLHYRNLERDKVKGLALNNGDFTAVIILSPSAMQEVDWWKVNLLGATRRIRPPPIAFIFQADASDTAWGVTCVTNVALESNGVWSAQH